MKKILYQPWGGLGDNLQFSTLPEMFSKLGYEVYISENNTYRNSEIFELVWKLNPYVKGISSEQHNIGDISTYRRIYPQKSIIYNQEASHGINPENEIPKIYYIPKIINEFQDKIFVDLSAKSSSPIKPKNIYSYLKDKYQNSQIIIPNFNNKVDNRKETNFKYDNIIDIQSIFHFCDLIHSCKHFYCCFSGQSVLASALNKTETTVFIRPEWKDIDWNFPNLKYEVVNE
jgi:hypothetical protein